MELRSSTNPSSQRNTARGIPCIHPSPTLHNRVCLDGGLPQLRWEHTTHAHATLVTGIVTNMQQWARSWNVNMCWDYVSMRRLLHLLWPKDQSSAMVTMRLHCQHLHGILPPSCMCWPGNQGTHSCWLGGTQPHTQTHTVKNIHTD